MRRRKQRTLSRRLVQMHRVRDVEAELRPHCLLELRELRADDAEVLEDALEVDQGGVCVQLGAQLLHLASKLHRARSKLHTDTAPDVAMCEPFARTLQVAHQEWRTTWRGT